MAFKGEKKTSSKQPKELDNRMKVRGLQRPTLVPAKKGAGAWVEAKGVATLQDWICWDDANF